jgi:hypothetical protein
MPDFDNRRREEPNEPNSRPRSPSIEGGVGNPLIAILRLAPTASYALAQIIVVGFWTYSVSAKYGVDLKHGSGPGLLALIGISALVIVPAGAILGAFDASTRRKSDPLVQVPLLVVDALLIGLFPLWIWDAEEDLLYTKSCGDYFCIHYKPGWPECIGGLIGAEMGLVVLVVVSMTMNRVLRRVARRVEA